MFQKSPSNVNPSNSQLYNNIQRRDTSIQNGKNIIDSSSTLNSVSVKNVPLSSDKFLLRDRVKMMEQYNIQPTQTRQPHTQHTPMQLMSVSNTLLVPQSRRDMRVNAVEISKRLRPVLSSSMYLQPQSTLGFNSSVPRNTAIDGGDVVGSTNGVAGVGGRIKTNQTNDNNNSNSSNNNNNNNSNNNNNPFHNRVRTVPRAPRAKAVCVPLPHTQHIAHLSHTTHTQHTHTDRVSLAQHEAVLSESLTETRKTLLASFVASLAHGLNDRPSLKWATKQRAHLATVSHNYQVKFRETLGFLVEIERARDHVKRLRVENERLKREELYLTQSAGGGGGGDAGALTEEEVLLVSDTSTPAHVPLDQLLAMIKDHIKQKHSQTQAIDREIGRLDLEMRLNPVSDSDPSLASNKAIKRAREMLTAFYASSLTEMEGDHGEVARTKQRVASLLDEAAVMRSEVGRKRVALTRLRENLRNCQDRKETLALSFREEIVEALASHDRLMTDLTAKTAAFSSHCSTVSHSLSQLSDNHHLALELTCPNCYRELRNPYLLWPCGHVLCHACVTSSMERTHSHTLSHTRRRLVCAECRNAFHVAQLALGEELETLQQDADIDALYAKVEADNLAQAQARANPKLDQPLLKQSSVLQALRQLSLFHNPYAREEPHFNNHHFAIPHRLVERLLLIVSSTQSDIQDAAEEHLRESSRLEQQMTMVLPVRRTLLEHLCGEQSHADNTAEGDTLVRNLVSKIVGPDQNSTTVLASLDEVIREQPLPVVHQVEKNQRSKIAQVDVDSIVNSVTVSEWSTVKSDLRETDLKD